MKDDDLGDGNGNDPVLMNVVQARAAAASSELAEAGKTPTKPSDEYPQENAAKHGVIGAQSTTEGMTSHQLESNESIKKTNLDNLDAGGGEDALVMELVHERAAAASSEPAEAEDNNTVDGMTQVQDHSRPGGYNGAPGMTPSRNLGTMSEGFECNGQQGSHDTHGREFRETSSDVPPLSNEADFTEKIAEAQPVDDQSHIFAADSATPIDVEARKAREQVAANTRKGLLFTGALALIAVIVAVIVVIVSLKKQQQLESETMAPATMAPTTSRELGVRAELARVIGEFVNEDDSPYQQAMDWILYEDAMILDEFSENLIQRYVLALFYFKTSQEGPWVSCNPRRQGEDHTCVFSEFTRNQTTNHVVYQTRNETEVRWLSERHECEWAEIWCYPAADGAVIAIDIMGQNLTGTMPEELRHLEGMMWLTLSFNPLTGTIPEVYGEFPGLTVFEATETFITGQIPGGFFSQPNLLQLNVAYTLNTGTIPTEIGQLSTLGWLFLFNTEISGVLPSEIGLLEDVKSMWLYDNRQLPGTLPSELGKLSLLEELKMGGNNHAGPLPSELGDLNNLKEFLFSGNEMGNTPLPDELWNMSSLIYFDIAGSHFGGSISTKIGKMTTLVGFKAARNEFSGTVPSEIGLLSNLILLWVHENGIEGDIPMEVCQLRGVSSSSLSFLNADCGGINPKVSCAAGCCTGCCDNEGVCQLTDL
ncbi:leucine Rich Repeat [Seminavis robusta]|uniref:Leucine Rich Repeat n=1 Tax=Seminavis robusta TaxID=568900 RepID=A0A9N8EAX9_9STRA|nr:leucine Rich Repeat [Seminavis robusta]|eukprot:Sro903_g218250.1 leucine Rich Repeat (706) ;mRNA; r:15689-17897